MNPVEEDEEGELCQPLGRKAQPDQRGGNCAPCPCGNAAQLLWSGIVEAVQGEWKLDLNALADFAQILREYIAAFAI